jgi:hypothetical protein
MLIDVIARITTGRDWPCREGAAPTGSAIVLAAEDGVADTILPRLLAAGGDPSRVHVIAAVRDGGGRRSIDLQRDLAALESKIIEIGDVALGDRPDIELSRQG